MISCIIPTVSGREAHLRRCLDAYERWGGEREMIVIKDEPTCGHAWAKGAELATGSHIHFSADDLEPHEGWWEAALACVELGALPSPRILSADGRLESSGNWAEDLPDGTLVRIARIPFLSREMWAAGGWVLKQHYYTDNWVWWRGQQLGIETQVCRGYLFTHHWAAEGRLESYQYDQLAYMQAGGQF